MALRLSVIFLAICAALIVSTNGILDQCRYHEFDCDNPVKCIPFSDHCNGIVDCEDKTDEESCVYVNPTRKSKSRDKGDKLRKDVAVESDVSYAKIIISSILIILVATLFVVMVLLYRKAYFKKTVITDFENPIYRATTAVNENNDDEKLQNL